MPWNHYHHFFFKGNKLHTGTSIYICYRSGLIYNVPDNVSQLNAMLHICLIILRQTNIFIFNIEFQKKFHQVY